MRLPSWSWFRERGSGDKKLSNAARVSSSVTLARRASPSTLAPTKPLRSFISNMAIHTSRCAGGSRHTELSKMEAHSLA
jgi:hypothetical protein